MQTDFVSMEYRKLREINLKNSNINTLILWLKHTFLAINIVLMYNCTLYFFAITVYLIFQCLSVAPSKRGIQFVLPAHIADIWSSIDTYQHVVAINVSPLLCRLFQHLGETIMEFGQVEWQAGLHTLTLFWILCL